MKKPIDYALHAGLDVFWQLSDEDYVDRITDACIDYHQDRLNELINSGEIVVVSSKTK